MYSTVAQYIRCELSTLLPPSGVNQRPPPRSALRIAKKSECVWVHRHKQFGQAPDSPRWHRGAWK